MVGACDSVGDGAKLCCVYIKISHLILETIPGMGKLRVKQSPTAHLPSVPMGACCFADSGGGITNLIVSVWARKDLNGETVATVYVVSPSVNVE